MSLSIKMNTSTVNTTLTAKRTIEWIVIHYTAGTSSAAGCAGSLAEWYKKGANPANPASSDFIVDDETVVQYNPDIQHRYSWGVAAASILRFPPPRAANIMENARTATVSISRSAATKRTKSL